VCEKDYACIGVREYARAYLAFYVQEIQNKTMVYEKSITDGARAPERERNSERDEPEVLSNKGPVD
jgi:hypothetical protein